jgi:hypothetical protein
MIKVKPGWTFGVTGEHCVRTTHITAKAHVTNRTFSSFQFLRCTYQSKFYRNLLVPVQSLAQNQADQPLFKPDLRPRERMLLSRLSKKRPKMLIPSTRRPLSASMDMMVSTHSYLERPKVAGCKLCQFPILSGTVRIIKMELSASSWRFVKNNACI